MKQPITAFDKTYPSYTALAADFDLDRQLVYTRIKTYLWSPEKAVLTAKHGSIRKSYSDHALLLKYPTLFKTVNQTREFVERFKLLKHIVTKEYSKQRKVLIKHLTPRHFDNMIQSGHGRYSIGRFLAEPILAKSIGCIYLAKIPFNDHSYYIKVGISKYLNAAKRKRSLPTGTIILGSQQAELHRCFQAEQIMLNELKQIDITIPNNFRFEGYSEILALISAKSPVNKKYITRLRTALKETKPYENFVKTRRK